MKIYGFLLFCTVVILTIGCGSDSLKSTPVTGATLYASNCASAGCHGPLATSEKRNATANQITNAITDVVQMQTASLQALTSAQIELIAQALAN